MCSVECVPTEGGEGCWCLGDTKKHDTCCADMQHSTRDTQRSTGHSVGFQKQLQEAFPDLYLVAR